MKRGQSTDSIYTENYTWPHIQHFFRLNCYLLDIYKDSAEEEPQNFSYAAMLKELSPDNFISSCSYQGRKLEHCSNLFKRAIIENGLCYSLNLLAPSEMYNENV